MPISNSRTLPIDSNEVLHRLLVTLYRSLAMYLADAAPWVHPGDARAVQVLRHIVDDHRRYSQRMVDLLMDRRAVVSYGEFPMGFTDTHDLSLDYLVSELIYYQKQDIAAIQGCIADLKMDLTARALAEEILGNAYGHLQSLEELFKEPASTA